MNILLIGATGKIGKNFLNKNLNKYDNVYALVRSSENAELMKSAGIVPIKNDIENYNFEILQSIDKVFLATTPGPYQVELQNRVLDKCSQYGVRHVIRISTIGAEKQEENPMLIDKWHIEIEEHAKKIGLPVTHIRPNFLMDNIKMHKDTILLGNLHGATGEGKITMVSSDDVFYVINHCLLSDDHIGKSYSLTGPEALSMYDVSEKLSSNLGIKVSYQDMLPENLYDYMISSGKPEWFALAMKEITEKDRNNGSNIKSNFLDKLSKEMQISFPAPMTFDQFVKEYMGSWDKG